MIFQSPVISANALILPSAGLASSVLLLALAPPHTISFDNGTTYYRQTDVQNLINTTG
jgi:hypothetical protein